MVLSLLLKSWVWRQVVFVVLTAMVLIQHLMAKKT